MEKDAEVGAGKQHSALGRQISLDSEAFIYPIVVCVFSYVSFSGS